MTDLHIRACSTAEAAELIHGARLAGLRFAGLLMPYAFGGEEPVERFARAVRKLALYEGIEAAAGVELRNVPPALIPEAVAEARRAGAEFVVCCGEAVGEPVEPGTNIAAVEAGVDIVAQPGLVDKETAAFAAEKEVALEFTSCPKLAFANAHAAAFAMQYGCPLVRGSSASAPSEITHRALWPLIAAGAEVSQGEAGVIMRYLRESEEKIVRRILSRAGK